MKHLTDDQRKFYYHITEVGSDTARHYRKALKEAKQNIDQFEYDVYEASAHFVGRIKKRHATRAGYFNYEKLKQMLDMYEKPVMTTGLFAKSKYKKAIRRYFNTIINDLEWFT